MIPGGRARNDAVRLMGLGLLVASAIILAPLGAPILLATWTAAVVEPLTRLLRRVLGGRRRGGAAVVLLLIIVISALLVAVGAAAVASAGEVFVRLSAAMGGHGTFSEAFLGGVMTTPRTPAEWIDLASRHGADAWRALAALAHASTSAFFRVIAFFVALYALAGSGTQLYRWCHRHVPIQRRAFARLMRAYYETGRGLMIGGGGTALVQGLIATVFYLVLGLPRALLLGPMTAACALVPVVGTGLVWFPLAIGLATMGDYVRAGIVLAVGAGVLGMVDNFVRPVLARHGHLRLPTAVVLISMLSGIAVLGPFGALLGPLLVRLTVEALAMARENGASASLPPSALLRSRPRELESSG